MRLSLAGYPIMRRAEQPDREVAGLVSNICESTMSEMPARACLLHVFDQRRYLTGRNYAFEVRRRTFSEYRFIEKCEVNWRFCAHALNILGRQPVLRSREIPFFTSITHLGLGLPWYLTLRNNTGCRCCLCQFTIFNRPRCAF